MDGAHTFENKEREEFPELLDVVQLDSRWAQVRGADAVLYLDTNKLVEIDWSHYVLEQRIDRVVQNLDSVGFSMSDEEKRHIHWGPEQEEYPHLVNSVTVFGSYRSKP